MEEKKEQIILHDKEEITVKIINNDVENLNDISANMDFNIVLIGPEGKSNLYKI